MFNMWCWYIDATPNVALLSIKGLVIRKEIHGIRHELLLVLLAKPQGEEFWVCLEKKGPSSITLGRPSSSALDKNDIVSAVIDLCCSFTASPSRQSFQGSSVYW